MLLPSNDDVKRGFDVRAARVHPQDVRSAHQSMHHLVADSEWSDAALLGRWRVKWCRC